MESTFLPTVKGSMRSSSAGSTSQGRAFQESRADPGFDDLPAVAPAPAGLAFCVWKLGKRSAGRSELAVAPNLPFRSADSPLEGFCFMPKNAVSLLRSLPASTGASSGAPHWASTAATASLAAKPPLGWFTGATICRAWVLPVDWLVPLVSFCEETTGSGATPTAPETRRRLANTFPPSPDMPNSRFRANGLGGAAGVEAWDEAALEPNVLLGVVSTSGSSSMLVLPFMTSSTMLMTVLRSPGSRCMDRCMRGASSSSSASFCGDGC
mmetsp:Transcript_73627/g.132660  ORF Transcript_73627/g.132660 Transcript_73627/m.132660 type:complete len:267 (+) Transcript_73627:125-925(+)